MIRLLTVLPVALALVTMPVRAQVMPRGQDAGSDNPLQDLRSRYPETATAGVGLALEGAIDPDEYIVGPGDVFAVIVRGFEREIGPVTVTADGRLPLPDSRSVRVADLTLAAARDSIVLALRPAFGRIEVEAALVQPRSFYVHVTGAVPVPGRYPAGPASRVATALELAYGDPARAPLTNLSLRPSFRNVTVVRRDGSEISVDLIRYFSGGGVEFNPYLRDGDVIIVNAYVPEFESLRVDGSVPFPGSYEARPGDTLAGVLAVAGVRGDAGFEKTVRVTRQAADGKPESVIVSLAEALSGEAASWMLRARDHVSVEPESRPGGSASVVGWVHFPGTYPIREGVTTVRELVEAAGGLREDALLSAAYLTRVIPREPDPDLGLQDSRLGRLPDLSALVSEDSLAVMQQMRLTDMSLADRMHFALAYRLQNRVPMDVGAMVDGTADPAVLMDGDRLVIPRDHHSVYVFGQVVNPGFVPYEPGRPLGQYVDAAGGAGPNAGAVMLLRNRNGELIDDPSAVVRSGDLVYVDRDRPVNETLEAQGAEFQDRQAASLERQATSAERQAANSERQVEIAAEQNRRAARYQFVSTVLSAITSVGTMVALIISLGRK